MNWQTLSADSHYKTAVAIQAELEQGHWQEAALGIEELIEALSRSEKRAIKGRSGGSPVLNNWSMRLNPLFN